MSRISPLPRPCSSIPLVSPLGMVSVHLCGEHLSPVTASAPAYFVEKEFWQQLAEASFWTFSLVCLTSGRRWLIQGQWELSCYLFPTWHQSWESQSEVSLSVLIRGWPKISGMRGTSATEMPAIYTPGGRAGKQSGSSAHILVLFAWKWRGRAQLLSSRNMQGQSSFLLLLFFLFG